MWAFAVGGHGAATARDAGHSAYLVPSDGRLRLPLGAAWQLHVGARLHCHVAGNADEHRGDWKASVRGGEPREARD